MAIVPGNKKTPEEEKAAEDEVLLREIDDAVREDQYRELGQKYGKPASLILILGLTLFGGYLFWDSQHESSLEASSETLISALDQAEAGNLDTASAYVAVLSEESQVATLASALMMQAGIAMNQNRVSDAVAIYARVAADEETPTIIKNLALIRELSASFDTRDPIEIVNKIEPLAIKESPWFGSAGELLAMAYAELGQMEKAGELFGEIARTEGIPETLRARARQMAGMMGVDAIGDADEFMRDQSISN